MTETGLSNGLVAVVFDMDGVLVDSAPHHDRAFRSVFLEEGIEDFDYRRYTGWRTVDVVLDVFRLADRTLTAVEAKQLADKKSALAYQSLESDYPLFPGCRETLAELSGRYSVGLASSASPESVELFLRLGCGPSVFQSILCSKDVTNSKPDPEIYKLAFNRLNAPPEHAAVIEDAVSGIQAAKGAAAGIVIGIAGSHSEQELMDAGATHVLSCLTELPAYLRDLHP